MVITVLKVSKTMDESLYVIFFACSNGYISYGRIIILSSNTLGNKLVSLSSQKKSYFSAAFSY
jgi:hypothetical protein